MATPFRIQVFGKPGCDKCSVLNQRLDRMLAKDEWQDFDKQYCDVETEEGMIAFSEAECVNPQRLPAMVVRRAMGDGNSYELVDNPMPGTVDEVCGKSHLYQYVGLQTDYSSQGRGVITPRMIETVLGTARG